MRTRALHDRLGWRTLLLSLSGWLLLACAGARGPTQLPALTPEQRSERLAFGSLHDDARVSTIADTQAAAELALELGNTDEAAVWTRRQLQLARIEVALAHLDGDAPEQANALAELDAAARFAMRLGDALPDDDLVLEASQYLRAPRKHRKQIARASRTARVGELHWGLDAVWDAMAGDDLTRAVLQRGTWQSRVRADRPQLSAKQLARVGASDLLWSLADEAAAARRVDELARLLDSMLDADAWELDALAAKLVLEALARGELEPDDALLPDLSPKHTQPLHAIARMQQRRRAAPDCHALTLLHARMLIAAGSSVDAEPLLAELGSLGKRERELQAALQAFAGLERGGAAELAAFEKWFDRAHAARSSWVTHALQPYAEDHAPERLHALGRAAERRLAGAHDGHALASASTSTLRRLALDPDNAEAVRGQAERALASRDPDTAAKLRLCRERSLADQACTDLLEQLGGLDGDTEQTLDALAVLGDSDVFLSWWLSVGEQLEPTQQLALTEHLRRYEHTRLGATTAFQDVALWNELATARLDDARARLAKTGALISFERQAMAGMLLADVDDGSLAPEQLGGALFHIDTAELTLSRYTEAWDVEYDEHDEEAAPELPDGPARSLWFARADMLAARGRWAAASMRFDLLLDQVEGPAKIVVAQRLLICAVLAKRPDERDTAIALLEREHPNDPLLHHARALAAERRGELEQAHAEWVALLRRWPNAVDVQDAVLRSMPQDHLELARVLPALQVTPASWRYRTSGLLDLAVGGDLDVDALLRLWTADYDDAWLLAHPQLAAQTEYANVGARALLQQLREQPDLAAARAFAPQLVRWLDAMPELNRAGWRGERLWLAHLLGHDDELAQLLAHPPVVGGYALPVEALHASMLLREAEQRGTLPDALHWALIQISLGVEADPALPSFLATLEDPSLARYACIYLADTDMREAAVARCTSSWREHGPSPHTANKIAFMAVVEPELLRSAGFDMDRFFADARTLPQLTRGYWIYYESLWESQQGRHERGAELRSEQLAISTFGPKLLFDELPQEHHRGPLVRQQLLFQYGTYALSGHALAAVSALRALELDRALHYAEHVLAWLPRPEPGEVPPFVAPEPWMVDASGLGDEVEPSTLRAMALQTIALGSLLRDDLEQRGLARTSASELIELHRQEPGPDALAEFVDAHANSHAAKLLWLSALIDARRRDEARTVALELLALERDNPQVLLEALPLLTDDDHLADAQVYLAEARTLHPEHFWLGDDVLPTVLTGADDGLPDWVRTPEGFDARLARVDAAALEALEPRRLANVDVAAEVFFPAAMDVTAERLAYTQAVPGHDDDDAPPLREQFVLRQARDTRCEGMDCAAAVLGEWAAAGYTLLWSRELELHGGPAIELLLAKRDRVVHNVVFPSGGNVFFYVTRTLPSDLEAFTPALALLHRSFRPLDWSISAKLAEGLRGYGRLPDDRVRLQARTLLDGASPDTHGCLLGDGHAGLTPETRGMLLLDLFLAAREPWQRIDLLACTEPGAAEAAPLALVSLLDAEPRVHAFGRAAVPVHTQRVRIDIQRNLYGDPQSALSDPSLTSSAGLPPFGLLQVLVTLPPSEAREITREMLGRKDTRLRSLALAANATIEWLDADASARSLTELEPLRTVLLEGSAKDASLATFSLAEIPSADNLAALRTRADALAKTTIESDDARKLASTLGTRLAMQLDRRDEARLRALGKAISRTPTDGETLRAEGLVRYFDDLLEDHRDGLTLLGRRGASEGHDRPVWWARYKQPRPRPRSVEQLREATIAELAPGREWTYVRVDELGLFAAAFEQLLRRLSPASPADAFLIRSVVTRTMLDGPFAQLREDAGLDLSAPVECVSPSDSGAFVCAATVRDRERLLASLARRQRGSDAGVALPIEVARQAFGLPPMLGALPLVLYSMVEAPEDDSADPARIGSERLRSQREVAGFQLETYSTVTIFEDHVSADHEHYLFLDDRLLVFSTAELAELFLREPPPGLAPLASSEPFQRARARMQGSALQAIYHDDELEQFSTQVAFDTNGVLFSAHLDGKPADVGELGVLVDMMPANPVALLGFAGALGDEPHEVFDDPGFERCNAHNLQAVQPVTTKPDATKPDPDADSDKQSRCGLASDDRLPPLSLIAPAQGVVFGWYPEVGHSLLQDWVVAVPLDADVQRAAKAAKLELPRDGEPPRRELELHWLRRGDALFIASTATLIEAVATHPPAPIDGPARFAVFELDGPRATAVVRELHRHYPGEQRKDGLRFWAASLGLVAHSEVQASWLDVAGRPKHSSAQMVANIELQLADLDGELGLIDRWLTSPELENAATLPRHLQARERDAGLVYTLRVADAEGFAQRAIPADNPRMHAEVLQVDRLRLTVLPSNAVPERSTAPLDSATRKRMLAAEGEFRSDHPKLVELAKRLTVEGDDAATVAAIVEFAHQRIRYELTPHSPDVVKLLEQGIGDCTEYALLTVTLLRAAGIPARLEEGMSASGTSMGAHAWAAWHDGQRWREIDPTAGTTSVGAGHLRLEVVDVLALLSLGEFEVLAIERAK